MSVAAGAGEVVGLGFNGITEMQQMTSSICSSASAGLEGRLKDTRDDKIYWVGKLPDGKCWMTQNLDLDLSKTKALTSEKSDVDDWTPGLDTQTTLSGFSNYDNTVQRSYDPGDYYYALESARNSCGADNTVGLSECTENGWKLAPNGLMKLIADNTWSTTDATSFYSATSYIATDGITICNKEADSYFGNMESDYIPCRIYYGPVFKFLHYHAGNYYTYATATAGTAPSGVGTAGSSICPQGWRLPRGSQYSGDFYTLIGGSTNADGAQFTTAPYYFVYSGSIYFGRIRNAGSEGYYLPSTATSDTQVGRLEVSAGVNISGATGRYFGFSVRCVAK